MTPPKFSLRGLLGVLTFVALSCVVLSKPSAYWIYPVPFLFCIFTTCAVFGATRNRWLSTAAGATVCILITAAIDAIYSGTSSAFRLGWAFELYKLLHDDPSNETITAFLASVHLISAFAVAAIATYVAGIIWPRNDA